MGNSILVDGYWTVNRAKLALSICLQEGSATVMAVTAAQARQALAIRGCQEEGTSRQPAGKIKSSAVLCEGAFPVLIRRV